MKTTRMKRVCKGVSRHHLHLAETQRQSEEWGSFMVNNSKASGVLSLEVAGVGNLEED